MSELGLHRLGHSLIDLVGGTPVVQLAKVVPEGAASVFVKLEWFSPTGSYKDRMAVSMIEEAERRGELQPGMTVVEYTAGSTGSALAFVCAAKGYEFKAVTNDAIAVEKLKTMRALGGETTVIPSDGGQITPDLAPRGIEQARAYASELGAYFTDQFHNTDSLLGCRAVGDELLEQMDRPIDVFCTVVGTGALAMGASAAFAEAGSATRVVLFEPASSAVISGGEPGTHRVEGIGVGFVPPLLDEDLYDEARPIDESEGRTMARRLAAEEGLLAGTSTGLNVAGAVSLAGELGPGHTVVTVAIDTGLKYLAGDLYAD